MKHNAKLPSTEVSSQTDCIQEECQECSIKDEVIEDLRLQLAKSKELHTTTENEWEKRKHDILNDWENNKKEIEIELNDLKKCIEEHENNKLLMNKDLEKIKKDKNKMEKQHETDILEIKIELRKSMDEAHAKVQENVRLAEEKKTLQGILKMNTELYEKRKEEDSKKNVAEVSVDDEDDFIEVMRNNKAKGYSRTGPATEAETIKETGTRPKTSFKCNKCDFEAKQETLLIGHMTAHEKNPNVVIYHCCDHCDHSFKTAGLLKRHMRQMHRDVEPSVEENGFQDGASFLPASEKLIICDNCEYKAKSKPEMTEHKEKLHGTQKQNPNNTCRYWLRGDCVYGNRCYFDHFLQSQKNIDRNMNKQEMFPRECWFQENCLRENCPFQHSSQSFLWNSPPNLNCYQEFPSFPKWTQHY